MTIHLSLLTQYHELACATAEHNLISLTAWHSMMRLSRPGTTQRECVCICALYSLLPCVEKPLIQSSRHSAIHIMVPPHPSLACHLLSSTFSIRPARAVLCIPIAFPLRPQMLANPPAFAKGSSPGISQFAAGGMLGQPSGGRAPAKR